MVHYDDDAPDELGQSTGWFDLRRTSLQHVAEILAGFDTVDPGLDLPSSGAATSSEPGNDPVATNRGPDRGDAPPARADPAGGARTGSTHSDGVQPLPQASSPAGDDHPTRVYQSAGLRLFADDPRARGRFDDVPGPGPSSDVVARLTVKRPAARALDLGCGGGYLSLLMARFSEQVVGTDFNPRALEVARINARWNQVPNVEFRTGDLFNPVSGMVFDLVVSNPPFVISPDHDYIYRDGGGDPGSICDRIMADLPIFLAEGSFATIQCHWPVRSGEVWWSRPASWLENTDCDLWLISYGMQPPAAYARTWLANARPGEAVPSGDLSRWLEWYSAQSIDHIAAGVLVLRKRTSGSNWARAIVAPRQPAGDCSPHLLRIFDAHDQLTSDDSPDALLDLPLGLPRGCRLTLEESASSGEVDRVRCEPDIGFSISLSGPSLTLLESLDGKRTPRSLLHADGSNSSLTADLLRLYGAGMLVAGDQSSGSQ